MPRRRLVNFAAVLLSGGARLGRAMSAEASAEACEKKVRLRLALVRHGESMNNVHEAQGEAAYRAGRVADPDLSPRGYRQAEVLGAFIADADRSAFLGVHPLDEAWVSPHVRTLLTIAPAAAKTGLRPPLATTSCGSEGGEGRCVTRA